jgi:hypothetical protein
MRIGFWTVPKRTLQHPARLFGALGEIAHKGKEHLLFFEQMLFEIAADPVKDQRNARELRVPRAMHLLKLREIPRDSGKCGPNVGMMDRHDVIDKATDRPPRDVIVVDDVGQQGGQGADELDRIVGSRRR